MYGSPEDIIYLIDPLIFLTQMVLLVALLLLAIFWPNIQRRLAPRDVVVASVVGFFPRVDDAARTVSRLREAGFTGRDMTVLSSIPYPEGAFETDTGPSWIRRFGLAGGIFGLLFGITLVTLGSLAYSLVTGGKPVPAIPVMAVLTYELTVLNVMLWTLGRFLYEARLPSAGGKLYDPRISDGMVGVIVRCATEEQANRAEETVSSLGAGDTRRVEGRVN